MVSGDVIQGEGTKCWNTTTLSTRGRGWLILAKTLGTRVLTVIFSDTFFHGLSLRKRKMPSYPGKKAFRNLPPNFHHLIPNILRVSKIPRKQKTQSYHSIIKRAGE